MTRPFVRLLAALAVCLAPAACSKQPPPTGALCSNCNVVLISLDTVRADHLGAYGYHRPTSPNVDKLARRSIVFEDAISQSSWTLPAHASLVTGQYPSAHGARITPLSDPGSSGENPAHLREEALRDSLLVRCSREQVALPD